MPPSLGARRCSEDVLLGGTSSFYWMKVSCNRFLGGKKKSIKCLFGLAASLDILPDFNRLRTPFWLNKFGSSGTSGSAGSCNVGWFGPSGQGFTRSQILWLVARVSNTRNPRLPSSAGLDKISLSWSKLKCLYIVEVKNGRYES